MDLPVLGGSLIEHVSFWVWLLSLRIMFDLFFSYVSEMGDGERENMPTSELLSSDLASRVCLACSAVAVALYLFFTLFLFPTDT